MIASDWISKNYIEIFGAVTGIIYVFLEIRQTIWLWPVGIITSAVYIWVFFTSKIYADMSLQGYYLVISCLGWYWWARGTGHRAQGAGQKDEWRKGGRIEEVKKELQVTRLKLKTGVVLAIVFVLLYASMWLVLTRLTDSPVPVWDAFITSLSIIATWMLARKIYEHWYLWIVVNFVSAVLFLTRGLYPTVILYVVYGVMSFGGLIAWKKTICSFRNSIVNLCDPEYSGIVYLSGKMKKSFKQQRNYEGREQSYTKVKKIKLIRFRKMNYFQSESYTVIVADGTFPQHNIPLEYLKNAKRIVCCDGSTQNLILSGIQPDAIVGDLDSLNDELANRFADRIYLDESQETNDLTKAVIMVQ